MRRTLPSARRCRIALRAAPDAALAALAAALVGCQLPLGPPAPPVDRPAQSRDLVLGEFREGQIHCGQGDCSDGWYVDLAQPGRLRIEVYAPVGPDVPAFKLTLQNDEEHPLKSVPPTRHSPRRLEKDVAAGRYRVLIESAGEDRSALAYEVVARVEASPPRRAAPPAPPRRVARPPEAPPPPERRPTPAPTGDAAPQTEPTAPPVRDDVIRAEVVDVEEPDPEAGTGLVIWLDQGSSDGVTRGARGRLVDGDRTLARFEIVEVLETGSRAAVRGELAGDITFETIAEIPRPGAP